MPRLIDAEAFAKKVYRAWDLWEKKGNDGFVFSDIITPILISMTTVDAEPVRHGHWEWDGDFICSNCGERGHRNKWNYCPNCGARMDEVEE